MMIQNPWKLQKIKSSVAQLDFIKENHENVINLEKLLIIITSAEFKKRK